MPLRDDPAPSPLAAIGFDAGWRAAFEAGGWDDAVAGRIAVEYQDRALVWTAAGDVEAFLSGRVRSRERGLDRPAVGDWVAVSPPSAASGPAVIRGMLPRRTVFLRRAAGERELPQVVAANIDRVLIVTSPNREFSARRLERYVTAIREGGAEPVVVLNKVDLAGDPAPFVAEARAAVGAGAVVQTSAVTRAGLDALYALTPAGLTVAMVGSSGVGKSTLANALLGGDTHAVAPVRPGDDRGRHTTRNRLMVRLPSGGVLIDTPGMRELQLWLDADDVDSAFGDVTELADGCRFRDCAHGDEPGCAVRAAIVSGALDSARLVGYQKLRAESRVAASRRLKR